MGNSNFSGSIRRFYTAALVVRLTIFFFLTAYALAYPHRFLLAALEGEGQDPALTVCWLLLMLVMVFRLFPSRLQSLGCQKEFGGRYRPTGRSPLEEEVRQADRGALRVLISWAALNTLVFLGHIVGWLGRRFLVCLAAFYAVCDLVCVLFFCPFQSWMMHNRCCTTCRIYNWDYLMICTPLLAIPGWMSRSACALAGVLFLRWEMSYRLHRERFFERSNGMLACPECMEQLCRYKRALSAGAHAHDPGTRK